MCSLLQIPPNLSPQEAVTIPDSFVSAYHTIATELGIPLPIKLPARAPEDADMPILVWGGSSSVGNYTLQVSHQLKFQSRHPGKDDV